MHRVYSQVNRAPVACEVVNADAALGRKIPHTCRTINGVNRRCRCTREARRKLAGGIHEPARTLKPRLHAPRSREKIPSKDDRREAHATIGASGNRQNARDRCPAGFDTRIVCCVRRRSIGLPKRHDVAAELELAAKNTCMKNWRQGPGQLESTPEKLEIGTVSYACSPIDKWAVLPTPCIAYLRDRIICCRRSNGFSTA